MTHLYPLGVLPKSAHKEKKPQKGVSKVAACLDCVESSGGFFRCCVGLLSRYPASAPPPVTLTLKAPPPARCTGPCLMKRRRDALEQ